MTERTYDVEDFNSIRCTGPHDVIVRTGIAAAVRAEGEDDALDALDVLAEDGMLTIGGGRSRGLFGPRQGPVTIHVDVPSLRRAALAGSGDMKIDAVEGETFKAAVAGSGGLQVERLAVERAKFSLAGSGSVLASGRADRARASIAGSGSANLAGLESRTAKVSIAGSGNVQAHASETAKVMVAGSGNVRIVGGARCKVHPDGERQGPVRLNLRVSRPAPVAPA